MPPFNVTEDGRDGMNRYFKRLELAKKLDPEAFSVSHPLVVSDEHIWRRHKGEEQVIRDHPELAPPVK